MDTDVKDQKSEKNNIILTSIDDSQNDELLQVDADKDSELNSLLPPRKGGMSRRSEKKSRRSVQWSDKNGNNLVEILEFQPSDVSDSDEEDSDSCICNIM